MLQERKSKRKTHKGVVFSNKMDKTVVVKVQRTCRHPKYGKVITRDRKVFAHNEGEPLNIGDAVTITETRPLSKLKRWRVVAQNTAK